ncbi:MAG: hypothetical protein M1837_001964 [Sclerophora amabilis]|nr:MAG: hypothetical protein M1837_001964 [Sclerophora amabilis]
MSPLPMEMQSPPAPAAPRAHERVPSPVDPIDRQDFAVHKQRKYSSTGGGRAWTEEEEVYLLQTRLQKMPYKHIATHLRKTELACRLHYHQLSHGTNRRKSSVSISSVSSGRSSVLMEQLSSPESDASTAPTTPENNTPLEGSPVIRKASIDFGQAGDMSSPEYAHKPLLPKPVFTTPQYGPTFKDTLRLDCNVTANRLTPIIDKERLREIYETHRMSFWKMIAADYGEGVNPAALEELWRKGSVQAPLSPDESVDPVEVRPAVGGGRRATMAVPASVTSHSGRGFSPINSSVSAPSAQPARRRGYFNLPTPSTAALSAAPTFSAGPLAATSIANLLNDSAEATTTSRNVSPTRSDNGDVTMRDARN